MCRSKELGGRRCPAHADPARVAAYNTHRRELYALKKQTSVSEESELTAFVKTYRNYGFPEISLARNDANLMELDTYIDEANEYRDIVWPEYDEDEWEELQYEAQGGTVGDPAESEIAALWDFTEDGYRIMRSHLLTPEKEHPSTNVTYTKIAAKLDSAISKAPEPVEPRTLYRGMRIPFADTEEQGLTDYLETNFPVGGVISQKNYMSTSLSIRIASGFTEFGSSKDSQVIFEIISKQGAPLGEATSLKNFNEMEVLMPREAQFRVVGVHENIPLSYTSRETVIPMATKTVIQIVDIHDEGIF